MTWVKIVVTKLPHAMIINEFKIIQTFCEIDDFILSCEQFFEGKFIGNKGPHAVHGPGISASEMMCIELFYHLSGFNCFQYYYEQAVKMGALQARPKGARLLLDGFMGLHCSSSSMLLGKL